MKRYRSASSAQGKALFSTYRKKTPSVVTVTMAPNNATAVQLTMPS